MVIEDSYPDFLGVIQSYRLVPLVSRNSTAKITSNYTFIDSLISLAFPSQRRNAIIRLWAPRYS